MSTGPGLFRGTMSCGDTFVSNTLLPSVTVTEVYTPDVGGRKVDRSQFVVGNTCPVYVQLV